MELLKLAAFCAVCLLPAVLLKKTAPEQALLLTLAVLLLAMARCLQALVPAVEEIRNLFSSADIETDHVAILLKTAAAALITKLCANLCRDGGSLSLATAVEFAGTTAILLIALPLLRSVVALLLGFFT